jgi:hypothetical protein
MSPRRDPVDDNAAGCSVVLNPEGSQRRLRSRDGIR